MANLFANSGDPDQTPRSAASDLDLHCLPITLLQVSRLQWVKQMQNSLRKRSQMLSISDLSSDVSDCSDSHFMTIDMCSLFGICGVSLHLHSNILLSFCSLESLTTINSEMYPPSTLNLVCLCLFCNAAHTF